MKESNVLPNVALIYGQMNEPPGARLRVGLSGLTVAEYFRDTEGQDVLVFIDNIFRFTQAGSDACPPRWDTSLRSRPRWASCRSALHRPRKGRSRRSRRFTCPRTTSPI